MRACLLQFFQQYEKLLISDNYVTRRQSLKVSLIVCSQHPSVCQAPICWHGFSRSYCEAAWKVQQ